MNPFRVSFANRTISSSPSPSSLLLVCSRTYAKLTMRNSRIGNPFLTHPPNKKNNRDQLSDNLFQGYYPSVGKTQVGGHQQVVTKKSSIAGQQQSGSQVNSADLPAEFRGLNDGEGELEMSAENSAPGVAKDQSKLARLCQQTSSVLASVLPAPFGGHKRSILCQFFGQVAFGSKSEKRAPLKQGQFPLSIIGNDQQIPAGYEPENVAILQQHQQPPVALLTNGRHPIQVVLEQHKRQQQHNRQLHSLAASVNQPTMDLKSSASVIDHAYHQKLEPPPTMFASNQKKNMQKQHQPSRQMKQEQPIKYSTPIAGNSFKPLASNQPQDMSTSGWRIYNQSLDESLSSTPSRSEAPFQFPTNSSASTTIKRTSLSPTSTTSTTTPNPPVEGSAAAKLSSRRPAQRNETTSERSNESKLTISSSKQTEGIKNQSLSSGKPPGFGSIGTSKQSSEKKSEFKLSSSTTGAPPKSTTSAANINQKVSNGETSESKRSKSESHGVRTIEVVAQVNGDQIQGGSEPPSAINRHTNSTSTTSTTQKPLGFGNDSRQVQKREELVIASINNLTRIAFGNQLRDTVKVINKLIDQQSELFSVPPKDPMQVLESKQDPSSGSTNKKRTNDQTNMTMSGKSRLATSKQQVVTLNDSSSTISPVLTKSTKKPKKQLVSTSSSASTGTKSPKRSSSGVPIFTSTTIKPRGSTLAASVKSERKSTFLGNELRRLSGSHAVSRSLALDSELTSTTTSGGVSRKINSKMELIGTPLPVPAISDIHRDKKPWQLSSRLPSSSTTRKSSTYIKSRTTTTSTPTISTKSPVVNRSTKSTKSSNSETLYPWLLPDKSVYQSDLFSPMGPVTEMKLTTADALRNWQSPRKSASITEQLIRARQASNAKPSQLVLNRLDGQTEKKASGKVDSLTTLKMSLTSNAQNSGGSSSGSSTTSMPPNGTQSRWIPTATTLSNHQLATSASTVGTIARLLKPTSVATPTSSDNANSSSSKPSVDTMTTVLSSTEKLKTNSSEDLLASSSSTPSWASAESFSSRSDLNDMRATDSISKYTSHWNEANELLTTTRRYYQQPMPQIANTGEFFSAETIASWPERYQTMMASQSTEAGSGSDLPGKTTPSFETTRRNGETYDTASTPRHKLDVSSTTKAAQEASPTTRSLMANLASITILPSNHKLAATTQEEESTDTDSTLTDETDEEADTATPTMQQTMKTTTRPEVPKQTIAAYTIIGSQPEPAQTIRDQQREDKSSASFPQLIDEHMLTSETKMPSSARLKPPYLGSSDEVNDEADSMALLDGGANRAHVSRKLYEQLVPSTKNFVGGQNPLNQYRFNLSALKYLAQNILASQSTASNSTDLDSEMSEVPTSSNSTGRMYDLLNASLPPNYYELLHSNDSSIRANSALTAKGIFGRAGNLLSDLRLLEQKKAAALLAAIRYQLPSPLVKPWDMASDSFTLGGTMRDRFDNGLPKDVTGDQLKDSLLLAHLGNALQNVLYKQRVVPRDELERRLSGASRKSDDSVDRRVDDIVYSIEGANMTSTEIEPKKASNGTSLTRKLFDKLLFDTISDNKTDFHAIDLTANNSTGRLSPVENYYLESNGKAYPKYITAADYQTASSVKPANLITRAAGSSLLSQNQRGNELVDRKPSGFICDDRAAGFYPDTETACRTFYHCSNTGHLLTFDCPTQTRFDERSLKCGPWYEVPCDTSRVKSRLF